MGDVRNAAGVPLTYKGRLWSKILDTLAGSAAANGDILYRTGGLWTRKAVGASGRILKVVSSLPDWSLPGGGGGIGFSACAYQSQDQSVSNATTGTTYVDSELAVGLVAGTFAFQVSAFTLGDSTPDMKMRMHFTGTATEVKYLQTNINIGNTTYGNSFEEAFDVDLIDTSNLARQIEYAGTFKGTTSGVLSFQFAQVTADASVIKTTKGGSLLVWQIA